MMKEDYYLFKFNILPFKNIYAISSLRFQLDKYIKPLNYYSYLIICPTQNLKNFTKKLLTRLFSPIFKFFNFFFIT